MFSLWSFCRRQGSSLVVVLTAITSALLVGHSSALLLRATQGHAPATQSGSSSSASSAQLQQGSPGSYYDAKGYAVDSKDQKQQVAFPGLYSGSSQDEKTLERKRGNRGKKKKPSATVRRNGLYSIIEDIDDKPDEVENASCLIAEVDFHLVLAEFEALAKELFHMGRRDRPQSDQVAVLKRAFTLFITARVLAPFCVVLTRNKPGSHHMPADDEKSQQEKKLIFMATWEEMKNAIGIGHDECDVDTWKDLALQLNVEESQREINIARAEIVTEEHVEVILNAKIQKAMEPRPVGGPKKNDRPRAGKSKEVKNRYVEEVEDQGDDGKPDEVENASCPIAEVDFHRILTKFEAFAKKLFHMGRRDRPQSDHVAVLKRAFTLFITARVLARFCVDLTGNKTGSHHMPAADEESQQEKKSKDIFMATWKEMKNAIGIGHDECDVDTWKDLALQLNVEKSQRKINKARAEIVTEQPQGEDILNAKIQKAMEPRPVGGPKETTDHARGKA